MEMRVTFVGSTASVETVSILEDFWHDYEFFKSRALAAEDGAPSERLEVKRYCRAALLMLLFYLEGVVNAWLKRLVQDSDWRRLETKALHEKVKELEDRIFPAPAAGLFVKDAKELRNDLAHFKPASDLKVHDQLTTELLTRTECSVTAWLTEVEGITGWIRHPNTQEEAHLLRDALGGTLESEGYSGAVPDKQRESNPHRQ